jgi:hypothetical protein
MRVRDTKRYFVVQVLVLKVMCDLQFDLNGVLMAAIHEIEAKGERLQLVHAHSLDAVSQLSHVLVRSLARLFVRRAATDCAGARWARAAVLVL